MAMSSNNDVIKSFVEHKANESTTLKSTGDCLYSYNTCISEFHDDVFVVNMTPYSVTSTKHRNTLLKLIKNKYTILYLYDIPKNIQRLWKH